MRRLLGLLAATALLGLPSAALADDTPYDVQGDGAPNVFIITMESPTTINICVDGFCGSEESSVFKTINVVGGASDDVLIVNQTFFLTNYRFDGLAVNFDGGTGNDHLQICDPDACPGSGITSTVYTPGAGTGQGTIVQTSPDGPLTIGFDSVTDVIDGAPGALTVEGTPDDDAITDGPGGDADHSQVTVGTLPPYEYTNKDTLTVDGNQGADRLELDDPGMPSGLSGDCASGQPVCFNGGSSAGDRVVVHGTPGVSDLPVVTPLGPDALGQVAGTVTGLPAAPGLAHSGAEDVDLLLQSTADDDRATLLGSPLDDHVTITPDVPARALDVAAELRQGTATAFVAPPLHVREADSSGTPRLDVSAGDGEDTVDHLGTDRDDALALTAAAGGGEDLTHRIAGALVAAVFTSGVEHHGAEGVQGADSLHVDGAVPGTTAWGGGDGADTLALAGTGGGPVAVSLADGTMQEAASGLVAATGTETFAAAAAGNSVSLTGGDADDRLRYVPTAADAGTITREGDDRTVRVSGADGLLRVDPAGGADAVTVRGTSAPDQVPLTRDPDTDTATAQVGSLLPIRLSNATEAARAEGAEGDDRFLVSGSGGPGVLTVAGGDDPSIDTLVATEDVTDAAVALGTDPSSGMLTAAAPAVGFTGLETVQVEGDGNGGLAVTGSAGTDQFTQSGNRITTGPGTGIAFSRFPSVALDAAGGSDAVVLNPRSTTGVTALSAAGGPSTDSVAVNGTDLGEALAYAPTATDAGRVDVAGAPPVRFTGAESLALDGRTSGASGDALTVDTSALGGTQVLEPGPAADAGAVQFRNGAGTASTAPDMTFARLGTGSLAIDDGATRRDRLVYRGTGGSDLFGVDPQGTVRLNTQIPVRTPGVQTLALDASEGSDTFDLPATHGFPGAAGAAGIQLDGGGPDAGDVVRLAGGGTAVTADLAASTVRAGGSSPVALAGIERTALDGAQDLAVLGGGDADVVRYTPSGAQAGTLARDADGGDLRFTTLAGALTVDPRGGADQVVAGGRSTGDATTVVRGATTVVQTEALKALRVAPATESLQVLAGDGADTTTVSGSGGPASLTVLGGLPTGAGDRLVVQAPSADVTYDAGPASGIIATPGGRIGYVEVEDLDLAGDGTGPVSVGGGAAPDSIGVGGTSEPVISIGGGPDVSYAGFTVLTVDGKGGDDHVDVSYVGLDGLQSLHVIGGMGLGDQLTIADQPGSARTLDVRPTAPDAGMFALGAPATAVSFESTENLLVDGMGGPDELRVQTPAGSQTVRATPGATDDAGAVAIAALIPVRFQRLGQGSVRLVDAAGARADSLVYDAGPAADAFRVVGSPNAVTLNTRVPVVPDSVANLTLNGYDGDDAYDVTGPVPFTALRADASGPDRADVLEIRGPAGPVRADLGAGTLVGYGGTLQLAGIERLVSDTGGGTLTEVGRDQDDAMCFDAMTPRDGRVYVVGAPAAGGAATNCTVDQRGTNLLHEFTDVGRLVLDPAAGADQVIVNGTPAADLLTLDLLSPSALVTVHPDRSNPAAFRLPAEVVVATTESLGVAADNGADRFDVTVHNNAAPTVFLDGEDPSSKSGADELVVRDGTGRVGYRNVTGHLFGSGTVYASYRNAFTQRIDYLSVESVTQYRDPKA